ncbi:MAG: FixH family protein [Candidatus Eisenbacteria bacterium]|nr:FixH family protein [Candidatus Eisenbacteria bacterium]
MNAARLWPAAIVVALLALVGFYAWAYRVADEPNGAVVEPDYYHKSLGWDSTQALRAGSERLGWTLDARPGPLGDDGSAELAVTLLDRDGRPVRGAHVSLEAIHNLDASRHVRVVLGGTGGGYAARVPFRHPGMWELRFEASRGAERFVTSLRRDLAR